MKWGQVTVTSHVQFGHWGEDGAGVMTYREGHYYGAETDWKRKANTRGADYASSPMYLLQRQTQDGGYTWAPPVQINPGVVMGDTMATYYGAPEQLLRLFNGDMLLFVAYMDAVRRSPPHYNIAVLHSDDGAANWRKAADFTVPEIRGAMEPSVVEVEPGKLYGVIRNKSGFVYEIRSDDFGMHWDATTRTEIPTVESMAKVLKLASGRLLMVWNNHSSSSQRPRYPLAAALSDDGGRSWGPAKALANETAANQLSNFNLLQASDGRILACTSHYRAQPPACSDLDMIVFDEAWLDAR